MLEGEQRRHFTRTIYSGIYGAHCCEVLFHCGLYSPFSFKELRRYQDCLLDNQDVDLVWNPSFFTIKMLLGSLLVYSETSLSKYVFLLVWNLLSTLN